MIKMTMLKCDFCPKDGHPFINLSTEHGKLAKKVGDKWKCFECQTEEIESLILELSPHSERAEEIITKRQKRLAGKLKTDEYMHSLKSGKSNAEIFKDKGIHVNVKRRSISL